MILRSIKNPLTSAAITLFIGAIGVTPSFAHTNLLVQTPAASSEVATWPSQLTLEFDEQLQNLGDEKANFLVVNNAAGDLWWFSSPLWCHWNGWAVASG